MTAEQAEVWHKVADIVKSRPKDFKMEHWERRAGFFRCRTAACIAGHVGIMHGDPYPKIKRRQAKSEAEWKARQAERLGLDQHAARYLFHGSIFWKKSGAKEWLRLLRNAAARVRDSEHLLTREEMTGIMEETLRR